MSGSIALPGKTGIWARVYRKPSAQALNSCARVERERENM